jgi:uncharacterized metal-binding protein YceD (DUF177 family)
MPIDKNPDVISVQDFSNDELLHLVDFQKIGNLQKIVKINASDEECKKLATRFKIESISSLTARCVIEPYHDIQYVKYSLTVELQANVTQACVVSLEPVAEEIDINFTVLFAGPKYFKNLDADNEIDFSQDEVDVELLGAYGQMQVNIGEVIAQHLAVNLDPYPKKQGALGTELGVKIASEEEDMTMRKKKGNPFAVLGALKDK